MGSPLGKYAAPAAAIGSLSIIAAYLFALTFGQYFGIAGDAVSSLEKIAYLAAGALFGSAVAVNGYKAPINELHKRLDDAGIPAVTTEVAP